MPELDESAQQVLSFWLSHGEGLSPAEVAEAHSQMWFRRDDEVDAEIEERFGDLVAQAHAEQLEHWAETAYGRLALIIVLDQFSRNIHRDSPVAFAGDPHARRHTRALLRAGEDREFHVHERLFAYLPLQHSEDVADQRHAVRLYGELVEQTRGEDRKAAENYLDYAHRHRDLIETYKRFPHRNKVLGRPDRPGEQDAPGFG